MCLIKTFITRKILLTLGNAVQIKNIKPVSTMSHGSQVKLLIQSSLGRARHGLRVLTDSDCLPQLLQGKVKVQDPE